MLVLQSQAPMIGDSTLNTVAALLLLFSGCAAIPPDPPYWFPVGPVYPELPAVIHASHADLLMACSSPRAQKGISGCMAYEIVEGEYMVRIHLAPDFDACIWNHERRHVSYKGQRWDHRDDWKLYRTNCGEES